MLRALPRATPPLELGRWSQAPPQGVLAAAVLAGVLLIVVLATGWAGGGNSGVPTVGGNPSAVVLPRPGTVRWPLSSPGPR